MDYEKYGPMLLIGLAVGVDYSMFYVKRQREERAAGRPVLDAIEVAAGTSGRSVLISGLTVLAAMSGMFLRSLAFRAGGTKAPRWQGRILGHEGQGSLARSLCRAVPDLAAPPPAR